MDPKAANASSNAAKTETKLALDHVSCPVSPFSQAFSRNEAALPTCAAFVL